MNKLALKKTNLAEQAYEVIHDLLLSGERFSPGAKISVEELSRELGVSRSPVWSAVAKLEAEGIVEVRPRQGVFFIGFDHRRLRELFVAREALEGAIARLAAENRDESAIKALRASVERQRRAGADGDLEIYAEEASAFHHVLASAAGNRVLEGMVQKLLAQIHAMCVRRTRRLGFIERLEEEHAAVVEALERGDGAGAEAAARAHIRRVAELDYSAEL
ncbi:MAG TPA: GntR family transcriptional regulator [Candidatus Sulfotelmatobacter sp.]|jgi:DNA-binding GntR family transcriptional regulator|nr:GntR family transcriptional regulator [Candidatus Sulfotelmatobacter sp.]